MFMLDYRPMVPLLLWYAIDGIVICTVYLQVTHLHKKRVSASGVPMPIPVPPCNQKKITSCFVV